MVKGSTTVKTEEYRRERIDEYVDNLSDKTENEWYATIERCAATKSNDMATFRFLVSFWRFIGKHKPEISRAVSSPRE